MVSRKFIQIVLHTFFLTIVLHLFSFSPSILADEKVNSPEITLETKDIDIGVVEPGEKASGVFIVENKGNADLEIKRVAPT